MKSLLDHAIRVAEHAYAPYSKFKVGAALLTESGRIYIGANVENASYGLSLCAERACIAAAISNGDFIITDIAVACISARIDAPLGTRLPCGACRQWLIELAPSANVWILGEQAPLKAAELMPKAFFIAENME